MLFAFYQETVLILLSKLDLKYWNYRKKENFENIALETSKLSNCKNVHVDPYNAFDNTFLRELQSSNKGKRREASNYLKPTKTSLLQL